MKFIHTSDLHIGKTVNGFSMLEEQKYVLSQILELTKNEQADAVFLCGDLYDRSVAPASAVKVLDDFLTQLVGTGAKVFAIAGNHDCGERISFGNRILKCRGLYMEGEPQEEVVYVDVADGYGSVRVHMLPFARPAQIRSIYKKELDNFERSVGEQIKHCHLLEQGRNVLLTHHFVINQGKEPEICESDSRVSVGGSDQVDAARFRDFDYVALGHLHGPQRIGRRKIFYSGSPLKYSFSEVWQEKSAVVGVLDGSGNVTVRKELLKPLHEMRIIKGKLADLVRDDVAAEGDCKDYIMAVLTDEGELFDPVGSLRSVYPNLMQLQFTKKQAAATAAGQPLCLDTQKKPAFQMFEEFFSQVMGKELTQRQRDMMKEVVEAAKEVE